ncbi:selenocysteine protein [Candidatus Woesearchaeota archaeon]|nr:selenocysteine protein [Candidatus Woesearchaeota archaeon]
MIVETLLETLKIILIIFVLMVIVEFFELKYRDKINNSITKKPLRQYTLSSLLGVTPGCFGAFFIVSSYAHGIVGFGALVAVMVATAGDEAFVMLAKIPGTALLIFFICLVLGIIAGFLADKIIKKTKLKISKPCEIEIHKKQDLQGKSFFRHFLKKHIYGHIIKEHIPRLFMWLFFTMLIINFLMLRFDLGSILPQNKLALILIAALVGIIPVSGPHIIFVLLFAQGIIPFSVLLVSSIVQDGHGMLPLLSHSVKDAFYVKIFNVIFGLGIGLILLAVGI